MSGTAVCALTGGLVALITWTAAAAVAGAVCADPVSAGAGEQYLVARAAGAPAAGAAAGLRAALMSARRSGTVMAVSAAAALVHVLFNLWLIPGAGEVDGIPQGPAMAAWSSAAASFMALLLLLALKLPWPGGWQAPEPARALQVLRTGVAPALQGLLTALGYAAFVAALGKGGAAMQGASTLLMSVAGLSYLVALGCGAAANTLVGQHLGAGDAPGALAALRRAVAVAAMVAGPLLIMMMVWPHGFLMAVRRAPEVMALAQAGMLPLSLGVAADQAGVVLMLGLVAAGRGGTVAAVQLSLHWLVLVPGAAVLAARGQGIPGSLWLFAGYRAVVALVMVVITARALRSRPHR